MENKTLITKKDLLSFRFLVIEIEDFKEEIKRLETLNLSGKSYINIKNEVLGIKDKTSRIAINIADLRKKIENRVKILNEKLKSFNDFIENIEDSETRIIMRFRYERGFPGKR